MRQIFLDTETTGVSIKDKHKIIEIGCVEMVDFMKTGRTYQAFLNPERHIDEGATRIHGKTWEMLKNKPRFAEVTGEFLDFIGDSELIIHNAPFDMGFVNYELALCGLPPLGNKVVDSLMVARKKYPGQQASLDALCKRLGVDNSGRNFHGALLDADLLADVFIKMCVGDGLITESPSLYASKNQSDDAINAVVTRTVDFPPRSFPLSDEELSAHEAFLKEIFK